MGRFYLDTEYTNGNYYTGDIFEIAVLSEKSGYVFHAYVKVRHELPVFIKKLCNVTDSILESEGQPFSEVIDALIKFIDQESKNDDDAGDSPIIIAHGGHLTDFPLLIVNCMKNSYDYTRFANYAFVDSMEILRSKGYDKPGLDSFSAPIGRHSAVYDVEVLRDVANKLLLQDINTSFQHTYTLEEIFHYLNGKLPLKIYQLYELVDQVKSRYAFEVELFRHVTKKTALSKKQVRNVLLYYYNK